MLLTIGIPTYNRCQTLKETVISIASEWRNDYGNQIEVIVSDNASTDSTKDIVELDEFKLINGKYFCNEKNLGPDLNFFSCWEKAKGEYVLLLSDDDILLKGSLKGIVSGLRRGPDVLYLSSPRWRDRDKKENDEENIMELYRDDEFLSELNVGVATLSALVLKKKHININNLNKYVGTFFTHIYALYDVMKYGGKHYIIRKNPTIGNRPANQRGYNVYDTWLIDFQDVLMHFCGLGISDSFIKNIFRIIIKYHIRIWLKNFLRRRTNLDLSIHFQAIIRSCVYWESWVYLYPYMLKLSLAKRWWGTE